MEVSSVKAIMMRYGGFVYVLLSFFMILIIFVNSLVFNSVFIGAPASVIFIVINGNFMGRTFFKESRLKLPLGILLFIAALGIIGWVFMIMYRLTLFEVTMTLCITSALSFILNRYEKIEQFMRKRL